MPGWLFPVALVVITMEIALAAGVLTRPDPAPRPSPSAAKSTTLDRDEHAAINALLVGRASAVLRRDRDAFLAGIDPRAEAFRRRQGAMFDNLAGVQIGDWSYDVRPERANEVPQRFGERAWSGEVEFHYALAGWDGQPTVQRQQLTFVERDGRWYLAADEAPGLLTARNLWDFGPVVAVSSPTALVLGHPASRARMERIKTIVGAATPQVTAVWGQWRRKVVVLVPADMTEAAALIPNAGDLSQLAAVTSAELDAQGGPPLGERVVVIPGPYGKLGADGQRVVLRHEITHVATRAVTSSSTPFWLSEGFADYVAYAPRPDRPETIARELAAEVRAGRAPERLPGEASFSPESPRLAQAYEASWLACKLIAERIGAQGLVRFYKAVSAGPGDADAALDSGLRAVLGMTTEQFVAQWRQYVKAQLG